MGNSETSSLRLRLSVDRRENQCGMPASGSDIVIAMTTSLLQQLEKCYSLIKIKPINSQS